GAGEVGVMKGRLLALILVAATVAFIVYGTLWPIPSAAAYASGEHFSGSMATPEASVRTLGEEIRAQAWDRAYASLANKAEFTESQFRRDLTSYYPDLRTYATLNSFEVEPLHASASDADVRFKMQWSTVVGPSMSTRDVHLVKIG